MNAQRLLQAPAQRLPLAILLALCLLAPLAAAGQSRFEPNDPEPIESLVRSVFHHGIPYERLDPYGPDAVPKLVDMLHSEADKEHWANVVWALGALGYPEGVEPLVDFLENRFQGEVDQPTFQALVLVPQSLGLLAASSPQAFGVLEGGLSRQGWQKRSLGWTFPTLGPGDRELLLIKLTINGLGLAGTPEAAARLDGLFEESRSQKASDDSELWQKIRPNLDEARRLNAKLRAQR